MSYIKCGQDTWPHGASVPLSVNCGYPLLREVFVKIKKTVFIKCLHPFYSSTHHYHQNLKTAGGRRFDSLGISGTLEIRLLEKAQSELV